MVIVRIPGGNTGGFYDTNKMNGNVLCRHHYRVYSYTRRALSSKTNYESTPSDTGKGPVTPENFTWCPKHNVAVCNAVCG